ncbi:MAG: hypothetical protein IJ347_04915 [Faecalibacterium sp.]|nr:hypothetical protein [Faecalibacterium sp.]
MTLHKRAYGRPLCFLLIAMAVGYLLYHSLAGGTLLANSPYDSYALMAENWLQGNLHLPDGASRPWLELAIFEGKYYVSFPPVPAVFALPWVLVCGSAAAVPSHLVAALYGLLGAAGVYCLFARRGFAPAACVWWALVCTVGSNFYWMSTNGGVWFAAQTLNFALLAWGLCFAAAQTTAQNTLAALCMALAVGCRPFSILLLAVYMLQLLVRHGFAGGRVRLPGRAFWLPFAAAAAVGAALALHNYVRFGSLLEFGHTYLPEFMREAEGQFHLSYFWGNLKNLLRPVTLTETLDLKFELFNGFLLFAANPVFLWWGVRLVRCAYKKQISAARAAAVVYFVLGLAALCLHRTLGGWQFGARYTVDLIPCVLLAEAFAPGGEKKAPADWEWLLCALACAFNIYGAVYMLSH